MAKQTINKGDYPGDPSADNIQSGFEKVNDNFTELYQQDVDEAAARAAADADLQSQIDDLEAAQNAGVIAFDTKAAMDADLAYDENTPATVNNDSTASNNGYYRKSGASGAGSWVKRDEFYATDISEDDDTVTSKGASPKWVGDFVDQEAGAAIANAENVTDEVFDGWVEGKEIDYVIRDKTTGNVLVVYFKDGTKKDYYEALRRDVDDSNDFQDSEGYGVKSENSVAVIQVSTQDGKTRIPNLTFDNSLEGIPIESTRNLVCIGDSRTYGSGASATPSGDGVQGFPYVLSQHFAQDSNGLRFVANLGIGGQTSNQIANRIGAYPVMLSIDAETLPASGAVNVTIDVGVDILANATFSFSQYGRLTISGTNYYGKLTRPAGTGSQQYTFTRDRIGAAVTGLDSVYRWEPDYSELLSRTAIIWCGRNDSDASDCADETLKATRAIIDTLKPLKKRFIVLSVCYGENDSETVKGYIDEANRQLQLAYPSNYLNVVSLMDNAAYYDPDGVHYTNAAYVALAASITTFLTQKDW